MNCYDCHAEDRVVPAVAVCHHCGAGLCGDHTTSVWEVVHHASGTGASTLPTRARRLLCTTCAVAGAEV
ncbi:DUF2180 family protein [Kitasatospora sp. NBC_00374]|uniref:DUF2180 family protein n=1 Tax=Kitasatospora sp. NBC_00374 TaxID=2975964 RepID=UPI0030E20E3A